MSMSSDDLKLIRSRAEHCFAGLNEAETEGSNGASAASWVGGAKNDENARSSRCLSFDHHGFIHIPAFADVNEVGAMKKQMKDLAKSWDPTKENSVFRTDEGQADAQGSDDYFLSSANRVHFFTEKGATNEDGSLKAEFAENKMGSLNKAGHGMHMLPGAFHDYSTSPKVRKLVRELGWKDPVVPQSMYIFKQPHVGGEVTSHQDSTFLFTEPRQTCLGLWLALDDATIENGCLWVRPGSHKESVRRIFVRNIEHFGKNAIDRRSNRATGDRTKPQMVFESLVDEDLLEAVPWEGKLPKDWQPPCEGLFQAGFAPVECKAGDLLAFCGELDHLSLPNYSPLQRHTFQLHLVDGPGSGVQWAKSNWLQYPEGEEFLSIKEKEYF